MSIQRPHYLYRCFDADDFLIYIGCTADIKKRMHNHHSSPRKCSRWLTACMARHTVSDPYPNLKAARAAEHDAIRVEDPLFNTHERGGGAMFSQVHVARYLVDRGHLELATETLCRCEIETDAWCHVHDKPNAAWLADEEAAS
ncbi:MAG: GIY-YIG nuclease family protein [Nocardioides sp.]|uniref:GIY-YIG nuclease family protein n=1 Tax=Nocardioides sp. TaxID=35761 RepID=UPI003D6B1036